MIEHPLFLGIALTVAGLIWLAYLIYLSVRDPLTMIRREEMRLKNNMAILGEEDEAEYLLSQIKSYYELRKVNARMEREIKKYPLLRKLVYAAMILIFLSCYGGNEIQAEVKYCRVIKVEPHWYADGIAAFVYFEDEHHNIYYSRIKIEDTAYYKVGLIIPAVMRK